MGKIRTSKKGGTRDDDENKLDFEGFLNPAVLNCYAEYMHENRVQSNGKVRESDNWQKGMPKEWYIKSGLRHTMDWWKEHRQYKSREGIKKALCGVMFNSMGYLNRILEEEGYGRKDK